MTKLDFALHLLRTAAEVANGHSQRIPTVSLMVLLELSRHPAGTWIRGSKLAAKIGRDANAISCSTRGAVEAGLLARRVGPQGGIRGQRAHEWAATPKGLSIVKRLLDTSHLPTTP